MGEFFNSYRSPQDTLFEGDKRRSSIDLFEGDFYNEDDHVVRGLSFAPAFQNLSDGKLHGIQSRALVLPGEPSVDLEVKPVFAGKTYYSSANVTDLATGILEYLNQLDSVVKLKSTKRSLSAEVCKNFQVHKLKVSFYVPTEEQDKVAVTWERKAGDGLEFNSTVVGAEKALADRGLDLSAVGMSMSHSPAFAAPMLPPLFPEGWGVESPAQGERTPDFLFELPALEIEPCTEEDFQPLLEMATSDPESMAEAAAQMCRMIDGVTDAAVVVKVLGEQPEVLLGLLNEAACVHAAPALVERLIARSQISAHDVASLIIERACTEPTQLGKRQLAKCLNFVLSVAQDPTGFDGFLEKVQALDSGIDEATSRHLREATYSLQALAC